MTKEEAFKILSHYQSWRRYDGPIGDGPEMQNPTELGKAIDVAIEVLSQLSLPSNIDEAAWKYADESCFDDPEFTATMLAFKAGAEWMAERNKEKIEQAFFSGYHECEDKMKKEFERRAMAGEVNNTGYPTTIQLHTFDSSLKNGDKVNIIIIKHEQD